MHTEAVAGSHVAEQVDGSAVCPELLALGTLEILAYSGMAVAED